MVGTISPYMVVVGNEGISFSAIITFYGNSAIIYTIYVTFLLVLVVLLICF